MLTAFLAYKKFIRPFSILIGLSIHSFAAAEGIYICQSRDDSVINFANLYLDTNGLWGELNYTATSLGLDEKLSLAHHVDFFYGSTDSASAVIYLYPYPGSTVGYAHLILTVKSSQTEKKYKMNIGCSMMP